MPQSPSLVQIQLPIPLNPLPLQQKNKTSRIPLSIPYAVLNEADRLMKCYRLRGSEQDLVMLWEVMEPSVKILAWQQWDRYQYRVGTVIESGDLVSLAKCVFFSRLLKGWDSKKGHFLRYACVTFYFEFKKYLRQYNRTGWNFESLESAYEGSRPKEPVAPTNPDLCDLQLEMSLQNLAKRRPLLARAAFSYLKGDKGSLRDAVISEQKIRGFSRSSLHRVIKDIRQNLIKEENEKVREEVM